MRAVLLTGAAQLLFMDRLPAYAVVDETVAMARRMVRPKAAGMVNAVLRNVERLVARHAADEPWQPAADRLPVFSNRAEPASDAGLKRRESADRPGTVQLNRPMLPEPADIVAHLAVVASMPEHVVKGWLETFGQAQATDLCLHGLKNAPTIVAVEPAFDAAGDPDRFVPHAEAGFVVWRGTHDELVAFLAGHAQRRVQDPASSRAVAALRELDFDTVLDYCAGRGTKTRQLAVEHADARVLATDIHADRFADLQVVADGLANVTAMPAEQAREQRVDLLLLDLPCSNTAVLARRPEARYRLTRKTVHRLLELQRQVVRDAMSTVVPDGHVLYSTCSVEPAENQRQVRWLVKQFGGEVVHEQQVLPAGSDTTYHDGSYHALVTIKRS